MTESELQPIKDFISSRRYISDSIAEMEENLEKAIAWSSRVGELLNEAERRYRLGYAEALNRLQSLEEETETTRKAKLEGLTADLRLDWQNLRNLNVILKSIRMSIMQAIRTRREEPH